MGLKLVPFHDQWPTHDKLDLHAIYLRPRYVQNKYGEDELERDEHGLQTWDITSPLPVRAHQKWLAKGMRYLTLADRGSLIDAARTGTLIGGKVADYDQHQHNGPWNYRMYVEGLGETHSEELRQLLADIDEFGPDVVEKLRKRENPAFKLPDHLRVTKAPPAATPIPAGPPEKAAKGHKEAAQ